MAAPQVCSLITTGPQLIPAGEAYTVVRFPFGTESYDEHGMHDPAQPDGETATDGHPRAGLIWPSADGWADLYAMLFWPDGGYNEVRDRFVRDPLDLSTGHDSTCTQDHAPTPGGQYLAKTWGMFVKVGTPVSVMVRHNSGSGVNLDFAEFKLAIHV
ncbi:hypothetical protein CLV63_13322 [Murinocardiopsis flavida]|uniref:Uncharacterized protein n=1 Tax=Murinocardiopsis flavida TaxID=645275 RepID=A0A2P8CPK9_9ACTN|nr:hypothetical protein [Murinocardiopsis flavida]PSK86905.1 hypothetical protein CLV63_13322 [Murinocardiopsis flavida]